MESWPAAAQNRQVAARARHGSVVQRHVARQQLGASWARCSGAFAVRWMVGSARASRVAAGFSTAVDSALSRLTRAFSRRSPWRRGGGPGCGLVARSPSPARSYHATRRPVSFVVTCAQCREEVLEADLIGDGEECALRDHLLAVHPKTAQPETRSVLLMALRRHRGAAVVAGLAAEPQSPSRPGVRGCGPTRPRRGGRGWRRGQRGAASCGVSITWPEDGAAGGLDSRRRMKLGPISAATRPKAIMMRNGTTWASAHRLNTTSCYTTAPMACHAGARARVDEFGDEPRPGADAGVAAPVPDYCQLSRPGNV